jgi:magnesium chelatase family protein
MQVEVPVIPFQEMQQHLSAESSLDVQGRVIAARKYQEARLGDKRTNNAMRQADLRRFAALDSATVAFMHQVMQSMGLSMRGYHRLLKVGRTIADLAGSSAITQDHLMEALSFRSMDGTS